MEAWLGTQYWLGVTVIITEQIVSRLSGGIRLAYAAYEGEGTHESVGEAHTQRGELAHQ